jgi:primosomal protein N' (replication factor Y)
VPLARTFDYLAPPGVPPSIGARVRVPFGRREEIGIVLGHASETDVPSNRLRRASAVLDTEAILGEEDLRLVRFTSDYYHHPIGEVAAAALPVALRHGKALATSVERVRVTPAAPDPDALRRRAPRQAELLSALRDAGPAGIDAERLAADVPGWRRAAKPMLEKGMLTIDAGIAADSADVLDPAAGPVLNADQERAVDAIVNTRGFRAFVLDGVTGSGKTEVYLRAIDAVLRAGRQVLVLVPEIGLTPQLVSRFERRFGFRPAAMHSSLSDNERLEAWRRTRNGAAGILVGTRSAVFTPIPRLGLIIVDEEHDHSFKQQEGLRYSARDLAIVRAQRRNIPVVLGSATPTLEVLKHCADGSYSRLELPQRAGGAKPPTLRLVDLVRHPARDGLSGVLETAIDEHLADSGQVLLFLNRRGYAPTLICTNCAAVAECRRCDARMTVHSGANELRCHHCGASRPLDTSCAQCSGTLKPLGEGTERLEERLRERFPGRNIVRIDSDSMRRKGAIDSALAAATRGDADILVGTQMLSKGHHFPKLTLVGIVNADQGLFGSDFRSDERLAQSIVQVAGRAGRESKPGTVLIQTAFPEHRFWDRLMHAGYPGVAADTLAERQKAGWPPYSHLALLRASSHRRADAIDCLEAAGKAAAATGLPALRVLGPVDAPLPRKAGRHRVQLLLETADRAALHRALRHVRAHLEEAPAARKARWSIDVDPVQLF